MNSVVSIGLDIVLTEEQRDGNYLEMISKILEENGIIVACASFHNDATDMYKKDYPEYLK